MLIQPNIVTKSGGADTTSITGSAVGAFVSTNQPRWQWKTLTRDGTAYTAYGTLGTKPTTNILYENSIEAPTLLRVMPFTGTSTNTTGGVRVVGWSMYLDGSTEDWIPTILADISFTRTSGTSVSNTVASTAWYPYPAASANTGTPAPILYAPGSAGTAPASVVVDTMGSQLIQVTCIAPAGDFAVMWNVL